MGDNVEFPLLAEQVMRIAKHPDAAIVRTSLNRVLEVLKGTLEQQCEVLSSLLEELEGTDFEALLREREQSVHEQYARKSELVTRQLAERCGAEREPAVA